MAPSEHQSDVERAQAARAWLAQQMGWEVRLDELRRPRSGSRPAPRRRPRPDTGLRRAG